MALEECVDAYAWLRTEAEKKEQTLGPRGPFRQSGVEVVSQLAHRRAGKPPPDPDDATAGTRAASARRVDGVPSDSVQSTTPACSP